MVRMLTKNNGHLDSIAADEHVNGGARIDGPNEIYRYRHLNRHTNYIEKLWGDAGHYFNQNGPLCSVTKYVKKVEREFHYYTEEWCSDNGIDVHDMSEEEFLMAQVSRNETD